MDAFDDRLRSAFADAQAIESDVLRTAPELSKLPPVASYLARDFSPEVVAGIRIAMENEDPPEKLLLLVLSMTAHAVLALPVLSRVHEASPEMWHEIWAINIERSLVNAREILALGDEMFGNGGFVAQMALDPTYRHAITHPDAPVAPKDLN